MLHCSYTPDCATSYPPGRGMRRPWRLAYDEPVKRGLTIVELLVTLAVFGILASIVATLLPRDGLSVNLAAETMVREIARARFEAVRTNRPTVLLIETADADQSGSYGICVDENADGACGAAERRNFLTVTFGEGDWSRVRLAAASITEIRFDTRGLPVTALQDQTITLSNQAGTIERTIRLNTTGRGAIE